MAIKTVDMVRKIRDKNYEKTHGLSHEEQLKLIHEESATFLRKLAKRKIPVDHKIKPGSDSRRTT